MKTKPLTKLKEVFDKKLSDKNEKILKLEEDLKKAKETKRGMIEKTVLFEFPDTFKVENFPKGFDILNIKDIKIPPYPKSILIENPTKEVSISNIDDLSKIIISALSEIKEAQPEPQPEPKPLWIDGTIMSFLEGLGYLLGKITNRVFKVAQTPESYITPQYVMMIDPKTGQPMAPVTNVHVNGFPSGGGSSNLANETISDALDTYKVSDIDDAGTTKYYGFLRKDGAWYIMKEDTVAKTYRYTKGSTGYETATTGAWATRASLSYDYFHNTF